MYQVSSCMGYICLPWCAEIKFCQFRFLLNLMVHACLLYRSFGAWPIIAMQQLFLLVPIQSIKVKQFNMLSCISQSLLHFDALTCDQRKISIACMAISGQGLDLYNEHAPSNVKRMLTGRCLFSAHHSR